MTLSPVSQLLARAQQGRYALGYFESWNLESLLGVIDAAEKTSSPVIIGFNGEFLTLPDKGLKENIAIYGALGLAAAENASVPCGLIFNECPLESGIHAAIDSGFNLVMLASHGFTFDEYLRRNSALVAYAHRRGVAVEAELGELPSGETGEIDVINSSTTDPEQAAYFVSTTRVDLLSVSVGNVHVLVGARKDLDLDLISKIRNRVGIPLGLHGGTGIAESSLRAAIQMGITKVNYGTYLKQHYLDAVRVVLGAGEENPHKILGMGGKEDMLAACRLAVRDAVLERIESLGCCGQGKGG